MRRFLLVAGLVAIAVPAAAQPNPFKTAKAGIKNAQVAYTMSGDMSGTSTVAFDGDRTARRATATTKMMGKTTTSDTWTLMTPDSTYSADLTKKKGTVAPNLLPYMVKAYDDLDGDAKKRLHQNMEDMASVLSKAFGATGLNGGEKLGTKTYAGQECEAKKFGSIEICTMTKAPIMLHTKASIVCLNYEETATDVKLGAASGDVFDKPAGVVFTPDPNLTRPDSTALGFVTYLSSQQLADSLAKAKADMAAAQAQGGGAGQPPKLTPEQQASMQKACETMKNLDVGKMIADASNQALKGMADAAKQAAVDAAKNAAENKVKGIFKKPKIPTL
ncbi:MAG TPA: hypothetical protein VFU23_16815 [Gemmatimonadales bacterium]|nr:hypothetical protein [Gemmatimonadales bacterium]